MRVLQVCSELFPLLKTGGLADVCAALPSALAAHGCEVRVLMPAFPAIKCRRRRREAVRTRVRACPRACRCCTEHWPTAPAST